MENLYSFLKKKLKENNMKIGTFIEKTKVSKSTVYRVMKGYQKPSDELLNVIIDILNLDTEDIRKLNYYISTIDMDESSIKASNEVKNFLFEPKDMSSTDIEFIYYKNGEKYVKFFSDIIDTIFNEISGKSAKLDVKIANSTDENVMNNIIKNLEKFENRTESFNIEHLLALSEKHPTKSIQILKNFIPMLEFINYNVLYTNSLPDLNSTMFSNYMMISYSYLEDGEEKFGYHIMSFLENAISTCYVGYLKDAIFDMFERNYSNIKQFYTSAICNSVSTDFISLMDDIEFKYANNEDGEIYLFKRTPCYKRIPTSVYENMKRRIIESDMVSEFVKKVNNMNYVGETEADIILNSIYESMSERYNVAKSIYTVDILSKNGLKKFAETGILSDHYTGMPPFTKEDVITILSDMKKRHLDPDEPYKFQIVGDVAETNFVLTVFKDKGFLIEHANEDKKCEVLNYCIIKDEPITNILYEFAKEYVPTRLALSDENAVNYIDSLINSLKESL